MLCSWPARRGFATHVRGMLDEEELHYAWRTTLSCFVCAECRRTKACLVSTYCRIENEIAYGIKEGAEFHDLNVQVKHSTQQAVGKNGRRSFRWSIGGFSFSNVICFNRDATPNLGDPLRSNLISHRGFNMPNEMVQLRSFSEEELLFDDQETKAVLQFFFPTEAGQIAAATITKEHRNLAQGLLVEAIDASYGMGWIEQVFRWSVNPGSGVKSAMTKLARRAVKQWFKHLKDQNLIEARIYERVRDQLCRNFRSVLAWSLIVRNEPARRATALAYIDYGIVRANERVWG